MTNTKSGTLFAHLRRIARSGLDSAEVSDRELVERFVQQRDPLAFEVLVWRHGAMVWATCSRILRRSHDIEDAFQATFLALARSAHSIGKRQAVAAWLHRVAFNAALTLKTSEKTVPLAREIPARPEPDHTAEELTCAVDHELNRLPERLRVVFVLCCLNGLTSAEAAKELGCPAGTVDSRLHTARCRLRKRLTHLGFGPSTLAGLGIAITLPAEVHSAAIEIALCGRISKNVADLATHALRTMKHQSSSAVLLVSCAFTLALAGGALWAFAGTNQEPVAPLRVNASAPIPKAEPDEGYIFLWRNGHPLAVRPGTKATVPLTPGFEGEHGYLHVGPDRQSSLVYISKRLTARPVNPERRDKLFVLSSKGTDGKPHRDEIRVEDVSQCQAFWGADGHTVYGYGFFIPHLKDDPPVDHTRDFVNWSYDTRTGKVTRLKLPGNVSVIDRTADGSLFLALSYENELGTSYNLGVIATGGGPFVGITQPGDLSPADFRFSPDGRYVLGRMYKKTDEHLMPELVLFDLKMHSRSLVKVPKESHVHGGCWSPDGKSIAFVWESEEEYKERTAPRDQKGVVVKSLRTTVTVARPDGSEARDIYTETEYWYGSIDWARFDFEPPARK